MARKKMLIPYFLCLLVLSVSISVCIQFYYLPHSHIDKQDPVTTQQSPIIYPYIAMIIDNRATSELVTSVLNVLQHIPPDWKVQIFTLNEHWPFYRQSSLEPFIKNNRVFMTPIDFSQKTSSDREFINLYLTSPSLWRQVRGEKVLFFQIDSAICSNSSYQLSDFLHYDFIGAPWKEGGCCNGGFSIRTRSKTLLLLESYYGRVPLHERNEDGWFAVNLRRFGGFVAPTFIAKTFSMESIYHPRPFAVHKSRDARPDREDVLRVCADCPEAKRIFSEC